MTHHIKLTRNHQRVLIEAILISMDIKDKKLRNPDSKRIMEDYYNDAAKKVYDNDIECGKTGTYPKDNIFGWLRDQFFHSGRFPDTEFGKLAISICEACAHNEYDKFCRMTIMNTLFE